MEKKLIIIAGPNGAGKSTIYQDRDLDIDKSISYVNPDIIAKNETKGNIIEAGKITLQRRKDLLSKNKSFVIETTFSGNSEINLIKEAKEKGYKVDLYYIALKDAYQSLDRVNLRVNEGGHDVPKNLILGRFNKSKNNLLENFDKVDKLTVFDNSKCNYKRIVFLNKGKISYDKSNKLAKDIYNKFELLKFKKGINLAQFAEYCNLEYKHRKSSKRFKVFEATNGDKIIIQKNAQNGHYTYFNSNNSEDCGSIIDFIQKRKPSFNLGHVRKICRNFSKEFKLKELDSNYKITATEGIVSDSNRKKMYNEFSTAKQINGTNNLFVKRKLDRDYIYPTNEKDPLKITVFEDKKGNYCFKLYDDNFACGIARESDNPNIKNPVDKGHKKGVWTNNNLQAKTILISENPIDAISYMQMKRDKNVFAMATLGQMSKDNIETIRKIVNHDSMKNKKIILGFDNDSQGKKYTELIKKEIPEVSERIKVEIPNLKDWNDDLQFQKKKSKKLNLS